MGHRPLSGLLFSNSVHFRPKDSQDTGDQEWEAGSLKAELDCVCGSQTRSQSGGCRAQGIVPEPWGSQDPGADSWAVFLGPLPAFSWLGMRREAAPGVGTQATSWLAGPCGRVDSSGCRCGVSLLVTSRANLCGLQESGMLQTWQNLAAVSPAPFLTCRPTVWHRFPVSV